MPVNPVSTSVNNYNTANPSQFSGVQAGFQTNDDKFNLQDILSITAMGAVGILPVAICIPFLAEFNLKYLNPIESFKGIREKVFKGNNLKMLWLPTAGAALGLCYGLYQYAADNFFNSTRKIKTAT